MLRGEAIDLEPVKNTYNRVLSLCRTMSIALFVGVPLVALCYLSVNVAFFIVLSYGEILNAEAVALVSRFAFEVLTLTL